MRWFFLSFFLFCVLFVGMWGWRGQVSTNSPIEVFQDMDHQDKVRYQQPSSFFADGVASRKPVAGTVPHGESWELAVNQAPTGTGHFTHDGGYYGTGLFGEFFGDGIPEQVSVDRQLIERGKERYGIYCVVCHAASGDGQGIVGQYWPGGMLPPTANLVNERVSDMPDGQLFWTITHGKGLMGPYSGNISIPDRWAIVTYLRALQTSQRAEIENEGVRAAFEAGQQAEGDGA